MQTVHTYTIALIVFVSFSIGGPNKNGTVLEVKGWEGETDVSFGYMFSKYWCTSMHNYYSSYVCAYVHTICPLTIIMYFTREVLQK